MTITIELTAKFHILPWIDFLWNNDDECGNNDKILAFGWGPMQFYFTNFSPINGGNRWRTMCSVFVDHNERAMKTMDTISTMDGVTTEDVARMADQIKKQILEA